MLKVSEKYIELSNGRLKMLHFDALSSTNEFGKHYAPVWKEDTVVYADHQTHGKGQQGSSWHTEKNQNLTFSYLTNLPHQTPFQWIARTSLALIYALSELGLNPIIKWPNDILVNRQKISGILIEQKKKITIIGIGLNVNQLDFSVPNATSLKNEMGRSFNLTLVLNLLLEQLLFYLRNPSDKVIRQLYLEKIWGYTAPIPIKLNQKISQLQIVGVNERGELEAMVDGQKRTFRQKELEFLYHL